MNDKNAGSILLTPIDIGPVTVPNRFVRSATHDYMAKDDGSITDRQIRLFEELAEGEVGLIITGHAYVQLSGKASPRQIAIHDDRFVPGLARVAKAVHKHPSKIFIQLAHAGRQTKKKVCGSTPISPSAVYDPSSRSMPREMTPVDVKNLIHEFIAAARRVRWAGFDGVQVHAAHGYLLSSFLSPHTNRRRDEWGGPLENRVRVVVEIIRGIKDATGPDFPVMAKLNSTDFLERGVNPGESVEISRILEAEGLDAVEVSGGMAEAGRGSVWQGPRSEDQEGYFVENAAAIKNAVHIPVSGLGGIRTLAVAERFVSEGRVDMISMSRPFIRDPRLVRRFREGEVTASECISCNKCFNPRGIRCAEVGE
jgi:2,4-dienoyl-CoA reductase-like NADH-dependent reductase (Old Yellow Enzyme family)